MRPQSSIVAALDSTGGAEASASSPTLLCAVLARVMLLVDAAAAPRTLHRFFETCVVLLCRFTKHFHRLKSRVHVSSRSAG
jgi:hypothetical protein